MGSAIGRSDLPPMAEPQRPARLDYQRWLDEVDDELVGAGVLVAEALPRVFRAFQQADPAGLLDARALAAEVDQRCRRVEHEGFLLLAREAPVAGDLRRLVAILRLIFAAERSTALLRHVAESAQRFDVRALPADLRQQIDELAVRSAEVFRRGVDAWRQKDPLAVHELDELDERIDTLCVGLLERAGEEVDASADLLVLGLLARYFERIADHGVEFARHSTFAATGERVERGA